MNWKTLENLNDLYMNRLTGNYLAEQALGKSLQEAKLIMVEKNKILKTDNFDSFFEQKWKVKYDEIKRFYEAYPFETYNFEMELIDSLMALAHNKEDIIENDLSLKEISTNYFGGAKKIKKRSSLYKAILLTLECDTLKVDEHDQQYLWVLHCENRKPRAVVLCENDNSLRKPRLNDIELWFAGGNNTNKLQYVIEPNIPFYYLCDWDNRGIEIFQRVKHLFPKIQLLMPHEPIKYKTLKEDQRWTIMINQNLFTEKELYIIEQLINHNQWIEEESIIWSI